MIYLILSLILGIGIGWGIRGLIIKHPKIIKCKECGFRSAEIYPKCPWCNSHPTTEI